MVIEPDDMVGPVGFVPTNIVGTIGCSIRFLESGRSRAP